MWRIKLAELYSKSVVWCNELKQLIKNIWLKYDMIDQADSNIFEREEYK